ncbi:class I SAM-dependent methyltransferase [Romboutsia sedimentorum]|uniref:class I SAM-dependent methyltransferase n=1 Tax=Romboutsia sedimentorum TaxID=1368474 RepID=UPI0024DF03C9|nr:class I SAM-dependent methyltransferase [Romboutsia sedimentorum]MDK2584575.1 class I SAM-dependent methyltransferase [Romboutsia sedimentorum]
MEYMGNKAFWDDKFINRKDSPLSAEKSIVENIMYFKEGSILDVACGDGRNTLFLLENNFKVTGVDFSAKAIERLKVFAKRNNYLVDTKLIDLSKQNSLNDIGVFDNILINHYRLSKDQLDEIERHLSDDGILFICGFGHKHKVDCKIREEDLIQPSDFENLKKSFDLIKYVENEDERGFFVTYIFKKIYISTKLDIKNSLYYR